MDSLGRHIIIELFDCNPKKIDDVIEVQKGMEQAAVEAGATLINSTFHHFAPMGVSGVVVIQESHLSIHTWPEYGFASVDIFTCGEHVNPWHAVEAIKKSFGTTHHSAVEMLRGQKSQLQKTEYQKTLPHQVGNSQSVNRQVWFTERTDNYAISVKHEGNLLYRRHSAFQRIEVYDTVSFGKMLVLDGVIVVTEKDGFVYHEMVTHVPMLSHKKPKKILILGGGDGAIAAEVLKYETVEQIDVVEIDNELKVVVERFFPKYHKALLDDRTNFHQKDIATIGAMESPKQYDVILDDVHNAVSLEKNGYTHLQMAKKQLNDDGLLVTSLGAPYLDKSQFLSNVEALKSVFKKENIAYYLANVPTFPTGLWCFAICSNSSLNLGNVPTERLNGFIGTPSFQYYSTEVHQAAFCLPTHLKSLLA